MTTCSEDVLLQVSDVKHKKGEGTLYVLNEHVAFILTNCETVSVSHQYRDIKTQKISSEFKSKVQLQLVFHDGAASTFQFVKADRVAAMADRDKVKDLLSKLLPKFKKKMSKELEEKNKILSENPFLFQLYKNLVMTHVVTADEFWQNHAPRHISEICSVYKQETGISGDFLEGIKRQTYASNTINISQETMQGIFKAYPAVYEKHRDFVPHKLSDTEFWKKFIESHYYHKDRIVGDSKDLFSDCVKGDESDMRKATKAMDAQDSDLNMRKWGEELAQHFGYGICYDDDKTVANIVNDNIIKRFNQQSIMVLKAASRDVQAAAGEPPSKKARICDKIALEDLKEDAVAEESTGLQLAKVEASANAVTSVKRDKKGRLEAANRGRVKVDLKDLSVAGKPINSKTAIEALMALIPGGSLMMNSCMEGEGSPLPPDVDKDFFNLYVALGDLLRHFWACFPATTPAQEERADRMHECLRKFHSVKLKPFEDDVLRQHSHLHQIASHLTALLNCAYAKYSARQSRRK